MRLSQVFWFSLSALCIGLLVSGCSTPSAQSIDRSSAIPSPIILNDTAPSQFAPFVVVSMGGYDPATRDTTTIDIGFQFKGHPVQFVGDEQVSCHDTRLQRYIGAFEASFPTATIAGQPFTCLYISGQISATLTFTLPIAPVILSPPDQAQVTRSASTVVLYHVAASTTLGVVALGPQSKAVPHANAISASQADIDTSTFSPGPGFISLTQEFVFQDLHGTGFQSLDGRGTAMTMVAVTWI